ncbi:MAG: MucR family transcriptional regulator [Hyphomicrobiales bacterium]|nr:MAG: MucR family transcriptional regulator [Hyphomicrobiales bacterium]
MSDQNEELIALTALIVSAYVTRNNVPTTDLPHVIASTHAALVGLAGPTPAVAPKPLLPAGPIRRSVTPDAIICLEDGRAFKTLKRHLSTSYGMTPEQYRLKWSLPADYPMVAPNYAEFRSAQAKSMGLGRKAGFVVRRATAKV